MSNHPSLKAATVQFQHQANNKNYNLLIMEKFIEQAAIEQVKILTFPECVLPATGMYPNSPRLR